MGVVKEQTTEGRGLHAVKKAKKGKKSIKNVTFTLSLYLSLTITSSQNPPPLRGGGALDDRTGRGM